MRFRHVSNQHSLMNVDLGGRKSDAWGGIHGFEHVRSQLLQCGIEVSHRFCLGSQAWVGVFKDCQSRHGKCRSLAGERLR